MAADKIHPENKTHPFDGKSAWARLPLGILSGTMTLGLMVGAYNVVMPREHQIHLFSKAKTEITSNQPAPKDPASAARQTLAKASVDPS